MFALPKQVDQSISRKEVKYPAERTRVHLVYAYLGEKIICRYSSPCRNLNCNTLGFVSLYNGMADSKRFANFKQWNFILCPSQRAILLGGVMV